PDGIASSARRRAAGLAFLAATRGVLADRARGLSADPLFAPRRASALALGLGTRLVRCGGTGSRPPFRWARGGDGGGRRPRQARRVQRGHARLVAPEPGGRPPAPRR